MNDDDLPPLVETPPGRYRHYKGGLYEVLGTARHSETLEPMTLYRALYGQRGLWVPAIRPPTVPQGMWVRPAAMFEEMVRVDGVLRPRFKRCGDSE